MLEEYGRRRRMLEAWARHDADTYRAFTGTMSSLSTSLPGMRVLDIGCGPNAPMTLMLHSAGVAVTGIDHKIGCLWGLGFKPSRYVDYMKEAGPARAARKLVGELVYDQHYYRVLQNALGFRLKGQDLDLRPMLAENLEFEDASFDVVHSNATWEHLPEPQAVNAQVARILRPGGLAFIEIHLFPSLSGGHDLPWIVPGKTDLGGVRPWRHLRDASWTAPVYLNRFREADYRRFFRETPSLEIVDWRTEYREGEELLTDELRQELSLYDPDELTKRSIIVVLRKRRPS